MITVTVVTWFSMSQRGHHFFHPRWRSRIRSWILTRSVVSQAACHQTSRRWWTLIPGRCAYAGDSLFDLRGGKRGKGSDFPLINKNNLNVLGRGPSHDEKHCMLIGNIACNLNFYSLVYAFFWKLHEYMYGNDPLKKSILPLQPTSNVFVWISLHHKRLFYF